MNAAFRRFERQQRLARIDRWLRELHENHPFYFLLLGVGLGLCAGGLLLGVIRFLDWLASRGGNLP